MNSIRLFARFALDSARIVTRGDWLYWTWIVTLLAVIAAGAAAWVHQSSAGLITTNMRDQVSWAFYIGNLTFLVGVAAAAVLLVIPAYVYNWGPIKEVVILGEFYEYFPSRTELTIAAGIFSVGFLLFTLMVKIATPIMLGEFQRPGTKLAH